MYSFASAVGTDVQVAPFDNVAVQFWPRLSCLGVSFSNKSRNFGREGPCPSQPLILAFHHHACKDFLDAALRNIERSVRSPETQTDFTPGDRVSIDEADYATSGIAETFLVAGNVPEMPRIHLNDIGEITFRCVRMRPAKTFVPFENAKSARLGVAYFTLFRAAII